MRALATAIAALPLLVAPAHANEPAPAPRPTAELLDVLGGSGSAAERKSAADALAAQAAQSLAELEKFALERKRASTPDERRAVLRGIGAAVPDKKGNFKNPKRQKKSEKDAEDQFDWMHELLALPPSSPAVREVVADVAVIRALAASKTVKGGAIILDMAFYADSMVYRDECGRYLRRMAPYSLPALVRSAAIRKKYSSRRRYAVYQMERVDLESPKKAMRSAGGDEKLMAALLTTYGDAGYRDAVAEVWSHTNDDTPSVRAAARKGWNAYVTKPPPPAPKRKLDLPGGKKTDKEMPLYLDYAELARIEVVRTHEEMFGELPNKRDKLKDLTAKIFAKWDSERDAATGIAINKALEKAAAGDLAGAATDLDRLLALDDHTSRGAEIARIYWQHAKELEEAGTWKDAAAAYRKASALDPEGENADAAMASHYYALGKSVEAEGGDPRSLFAKASEIQPKHAGAHKALTGRELDNGKPQWMLYAGVGGGAFALLLLVVGLVRRRH